jgi:hypothetical protein
MATTKFKLVLHPEGFNQARNDPRIQAKLDEMGEAIVQATGMPDDFESFSSPNTTRARTIVATASHEGREAEAVDRTLSRAFDAGRS